MVEDSLWPRASHWLKAAASGKADLGLFGVPAFETSLSATAAHATPNEIRDALARYSTFSTSTQTDVSSLDFRDFGDSDRPDSDEGETRTMELASKVAANSGLAIALGGDNSITYAVMRGVFGERLSSSALVTFDAHHDLRDGVSNGSPVRRLIEAGLPGERVVQIGIADFSNSAAYSKRAHELGIHVIPRSELRQRTAESIWEEALAVVGDREIHVDFDMDVCDRSVVPGCPAAAPGGFSADEMRQFAFLVGQTNQVRSFDIAEIDALADSADGRTIRLAALTILEAAAGFKLRV